MAQVIVEQPGVSPLTVPLNKAETRFGRSEDSDVVLTADEVSRNHVKFLRRETGFVVLDLKSMNGTYVNRQRIVERVLSDKDEIWLGSKCRLIFHDDTPEQRAAQNAAPPDDSELMHSVDAIRAEMDQVGNSMTMIGRPLAKDGASEGVPAPSEVDVKKMSRAYRRLAAIHQTGQIMASGFDLDERLAKVLDIFLETLGAQRGFVMLREANSEELTVRVARMTDQELSAGSPSMGIARRAAIKGEPVLMADRESNQEFGMRESIIRRSIVSAMCVPLRIENRILGSVYLDSSKAGATFAEEDLELFASLASQAAMAIDNVRLHEQVVEEEKKRQSLGRFLSPAIVEKILSSGSSLTLGGQKTLVAAMFCDIRGSSKLAEQLSPQELVASLNEHFTAMTELIFSHQGTLDKYIGDEIMAVFGAPLSSGDDAFQAVKAAIAIQKKNEELNTQRREAGRHEMHVGIGIETGEVIAGYMGSPMRMEFTVVGDRVNTAKRFCDMAAAGSVVIGENTYNAVKLRVNARPTGTMKLKGKELPVHAYEVLGLRFQDA